MTDNENSSRRVVRRLVLTFILLCWLGTPITSTAFLIPVGTTRTCTRCQPLPHLATRRRGEKSARFQRIKRNNHGSHHSSVSRLSTAEILAELNRLSVRYHPTSTREELEELLLQRQHINNNQQHSNNAINDGEAITINVASSPNDVPGMVQELMARGIRVPNYASRQDLKRLLRETPPSNKETKPRRRKHKAIPRLLKELDKLGIKYPPQASPAMLEQLLRENSHSQNLNRSSSKRRRHAESTETTDLERENQKQSRTRKRKNTSNLQNFSKTSSLSIAELLSELKRRGIRFPPTASREDLEDLLTNQSEPPAGTSRSESSRTAKTRPIRDYSTEFNHGRTTSHHKPPPLTDKLDTIYEDDKDEPLSRNKRRSVNPLENTKIQDSLWSKVYGKSKETVRDSLGTATSRISDVAERAVRKARYATRTAKDWLAEDEDGIRDADYYYNKKIPIDVSAEPVDVDVNAKSYRTSAASNPYYRRPSPPAQSWEQGNPREGPPRRRPTTTRRNQRTSTIRRRRSVEVPPGRCSLRQQKSESARNSAAQSALFRLPPADPIKSDSAAGAETSAKASKVKKDRDTKSSSDSARRIYTPYDHNDLPSQVYRDSLDRFGEFVADTTENILWGRFDGDDRGKTDSNPKQEKKAYTEQRRRPKKERKVSWKDRMEKRFDSMLGIHEQGEYYNRWARQEEADEKNEGGHDAFSVAQGKAPKSGHRPKRKKVYDRPFWEQENLVSSLFGKLPPDGYNSVGMGNLLPLIRGLVRSVVLLATNACEWASVRGSLPQPVVVVGVTSCLVSARRGTRLLAAGAALVAFRIFGELIHEGLYGDEDWEEYEETEDIDDEIVD